MRQFEEKEETTPSSPERRPRDSVPRRIEMERTPLAVSVACDSSYILVGQRGGIVARYDLDSLLQPSDHKKPDGLYKPQSGSSTSVGSYEEVECRAVVQPEYRA